MKETDSDSGEGDKGPQGVERERAKNNLTADVFMCFCMGDLPAWFVRSYCPTVSCASER